MQYNNSSRDLNTPLLTMGKKILHAEVNKKTLDLSNTLYKMDLTVIYKTFHTAATEYTSFSSVQRTFSMTVHMLGPKTNLSKEDRNYIAYLF